MSDERAQEYVDILTAGGTITVDFTETADQGLLTDDFEFDGSKGEVIQAVQKNIEQGLVLVLVSGDQALIEPGVAISWTYRESKR